MPVFNLTMSEWVISGLTIVIIALALIKIRKM